MRGQIESRHAVTCLVELHEALRELAFDVAMLKGVKEELVDWKEGGGLEPVVDYLSEHWRDECVLLLHDLLDDAEMVLHPVVSLRECLASSDDRCDRNDRLAFFLGGEVYEDAFRRIEGAVCAALSEDDVPARLERLESEANRLFDLLFAVLRNRDTGGDGKG